jgi:hypothetical protein
MSRNRPTFTVDGASFFLQSKRAGWDANLTSELTKFIGETKHSLDCAIYDLRDSEVLNALNKIQQGQNKIQLRIVYDGGKQRAGGDSNPDPKPSGTETALQNAGLEGVSTPVHEKGIHIMHDKFLVRDDSHI